MTEEHNMEELLELPAEEVDLDELASMSPGEQRAKIIVLLREMKDYLSGIEYELLELQGEIEKLSS